MKISLIVNKDKARALEVADSVVKELAPLGVELLSCEDCPVENTTVKATAEDAIRSCDIAVTIGGDGTIIHNAKYAAAYDKPLLGINLGRVGFVANIEPDETRELKKLVTGEYRIQKRMLLEIVVEQNGVQRRFTAVNEAVLQRDTRSNMVDMSVALHGERIISYRADGMLFSTPTGSTAYSFSAGGPVIEPDMRCILLTPICPQALSSRQAVFGEDAVLSAKVYPTSGLSCYMTVDGQYHIPILSDDSVTVRKSPKELQLIIIKEKNFYTLLNEKLKEF
ncbi:MAG: NAD(+)/NADH kinase [Ruminococcus sp.]|uniref:NAD(+)/NADH kinase n=1 Tax=Ruminococcus sp. TaxID=41978 RepID=UPI002873C17F|nr:NAD(+)/NADH kinase [Ruminococcus sp.]MBQ3286191.1 NAD(+)/NADH kinase [Ruminococcus sp.]